jgi:hypothetical protein
MKVYEYVAYFVPTEQQAKAGKTAAIILDAKEIADSEEALRRKVIRAIPADYEDVIGQIKIEIRAFR